jgi:hypothetical protein
MKNPISRSLHSLGILALACGALFAQDSKVVPQMGITKGSPVVHTAAAPPPALVKIFSSLGTATDLYDDTNGWLVEGPTNPNTGAAQFIGNRFTPKSTGTVQEIEIALQWDGAGTNNATIALYTDSNGLPGKQLRAWPVQNLPAFGTCCSLVAVKDPNGIPVTGGTQYWVVALTTTASESAYNVWDYTWTDATGTIAFTGNATSGVWTSYNGQVNAFAVYGTQD